MKIFTIKEIIDSKKELPKIKDAGETFRCLIGIGYTSKWVDLGETYECVWVSESISVI